MSAEPDETQPNLKATNTVAAASQFVLGTVGAESYGVTAEALAHALALGMHNASTEQFAGSQISDAAVAQVCVEILKAGGGGN